MPRSVQNCGRPCLPVPAPLTLTSERSLIGIEMRVGHCPTTHVNNPLLSWPDIQEKIYEEIVDVFGPIRDVDVGNG